MREIFLGKPWHWVLIIGLCVLMWATGAYKLHVIHFNAFILAMIAGGTVVTLLVAMTTRPGEKVTRDPIVEPENDEGAKITGD